ncbi:Rieske [2Fe-2S] iron-sulfur domain-containing protein [Baffinella frigidus]|nr:Rieske [2Fe-2S] iron-sulfur domain-containing protein [Cryptophyta sp. CCMP2293]
MDPPVHGICGLPDGFAPPDRPPEPFVARAMVVEGGGTRSLRVRGVKEGSKEGEGDLALFVRGDRVVAIDATCPHQGGKLELGAIEDLGRDGRVTCPRHGWCFDLADGFCEDISDYGVQAYETLVQSGIVYVGKPKPQPARE